MTDNEKRLINKVSSISLELAEAKRKALDLETTVAQLSRLLYEKNLHMETNYGKVKE